MVNSAIFFIGLLILIFFSVIIILEVIFRIRDKISNILYPGNLEDQWSKKYLKYNKSSLAIFKVMKIII